jgi:acyl-CoA dehydrogenase
VSDIDTFRTQTRAWLAENCPQSMRSPYTTDEDLVWGGRNAKFVSEDQKLWLDRMASRGWTAPTWPAEYGGGGLDREHAKVLAEEMAHIHARPALESFGISMLGPALLKFGSDELKQQHLPPIVRGEIRWAQGYSEPNAGSDLASLQTRATDEGDHYVLNGSKIWTSYGDKGDWMFCLVRTDVDARKHEGISFVLLDMTTPGVTTKPIRLISGSSPFTETFFENARVEKNQVVGEVNKGWTVAKYLLTHEREMIGESGVASAGAESLSEIAISQFGTSNGKLSDSVLRSSVAKFEIDEACLALTINRAQDETKAGVSLGAVSSMFKYYGTELNMRRYELLMDLHGTEALAWESEDGGLLPKSWLRTKGNSIEGGTSEIQLNIIAKRILNLPS